LAIIGALPGHQRFLLVNWAQNLIGAGIRHRRLEREILHVSDGVLHTRGDSGSTMVIYERISGFLDPADVERFCGLIQDQSDLFTETKGKAGLGPKYRVINGNQIRERLLPIAELGENRVMPEAERLFEQRLQFLRSPRRSMRIQRYAQKTHEFRWHRDAHDYVALVTLRNTNRGETQVISPALSRFLKYLLYPFYAVPQVFSIFPYESIVSEPGDLLLMRGSAVLHRGITMMEDGERTLMVYTFDAHGKKPSVFRDRIARFLNY
jgi:hypothetical protein